MRKTRLRLASKACEKGEYRFPLRAHLMQRLRSQSEFGSLAVQFLSAKTMLHSPLVEKLDIHLPLRRVLASREKKEHGFKSRLAGEDRAKLTMEMTEIEDVTIRQHYLWRGIRLGDIVEAVEAAEAAVGPSFHE